MNFERRIVFRLLGKTAWIGVVIAGFMVLGGWTWFWEDENPAEKGQEEVHNSQWFGQGWEPGEPEPRDIRFSHLRHVEKEELACEDCHAGAREQDRAGMPEMDLCADCHDVETDEDKDDLSGCLLCHAIAQLPPTCTEAACPEDELPEITTVLGPKPYRNLRYPTEDDPAGFSHRKHFEKEIACASCHDGVAQDETGVFPSGKYMPRPQRCFDCHSKELGNFTHKRHSEKKIGCSDCHGDIAQDDTIPIPRGKFRPTGLPTTTPKLCAECHQPIATDCKTCHVPDSFDRKVAPGNHNKGWEKFHGTVAKLTEAELHGKSCQTCHAQKDCTDCHSEEAPKDHNNFWRRRSHGLIAAGDRERCAACHRQDFCVACHSETAPRNHVGNWAISRHCPWCHLNAGFTGTNDNCQVCHRTIPHTTAPHPINAGSASCFLSGCHNSVTGSAK